MKVSELIEKLSKLNQDAEVIMSSDSEGNYYSPLYGYYDNAIYVPETSWSGEVYLEKLTEELERHGYTEEDVYYGKDGVVAIVLRPTN